MREHPTREYYFDAKCEDAPHESSIPPLHINWNINTGTKGKMIVILILVLVPVVRLVVVVVVVAAAAVAAVAAAAGPRHAATHHRTLLHFMFTWRAGLACGSF